MNKNDERKIRLAHEIAVAGGVHAILTADQLGLLLAEIDILRADLRVLAKKDNYTTSSDGFEDIWLMIDDEPDPADFAAAALKRSEGASTP